MTFTSEDLLKRGKERLKGQWKDLEETARDDFEAALKDYADLLLRAAEGDAPDYVVREMKIVEATIINWTWIGSSYAKRVALEVLHEAATAIGDIIGGAAKRLVKGLR